MRALCGCVRCVTGRRRPSSRSPGRRPRRRCGRGRCARRSAGDGEGRRRAAGGIGGLEGRSRPARPAAADWRGGCAAGAAGDLDGAPPEATAARGEMQRRRRVGTGGAWARATARREEARWAAEAGLGRDGRARACGRRCFGGLLGGAPSLDGLARVLDAHQRWQGSGASGPRSLRSAYGVSLPGSRGRVALRPGRGDSPQRMGPPLPAHPRRARQDGHSAVCWHDGTSGSGGL